MFAAGKNTTNTILPQSSSLVRDVELGADGTLIGQVVDAQGNPIAGEAVSLMQGGRVVVNAKTSEAGYYTIQGLRGGLYHVSTKDSGQVCRLWTHKTAPPAAITQLLLVDGKQIQRGQRPIGDIITNPLLVGLVIAAAVAIPLAVANADDDDPSGS